MGWNGSGKGEVMGVPGQDMADGQIWGVERNPKVSSLARLFLPRYLAGDVLRRRSLEEKGLQAAQGETQQPRFQWAAGVVTRQRILRSSPHS